MRRPSLLLLLALLVTAALAAPAGAAEVTVVEQDLSQYPEVSLLVAGSAVDADDLDADEFEVTENGLRVDAAVERIDEPLDVVLAVDTSGSMKGAAMEGARAAARRFVDRLRPDTRVAVMGFGATAGLAQEFTTDRDRQKASIDGLVAQGETALYDGVAAAARVFGESNGRRAIVLLSDGGDTASTLGIDAALVAVAEARASLWAVSLTTSESDPGALERLAGSTGGRVVAAEDPAALDGAYASVAGDLTSRYLVRYRTATTGPASLVVNVGGGSTTVQLAFPAALPGDRTAWSLLDPRDGDDRLLYAGAAAMFLALAGSLAMVLSSRTTVRLGRDARSGRGLQQVVSELASRASASAERTLERRGNRRGVEAALEQAGIRLRAGEAMVLLAVALLLGGAVAGLLVTPPAAPIGAAVAGVAAVAAVRVLRDRRRRRFADQLDDLLQLISGSLRAGYGLVQAVETAATEMEAPAGDELRRLTTEVRLGRDLTDALDSTAARLANDDFTWAAQAIRIHHEVGGDLAEVLDRVAETIRAREHLRRQVSALSAEGRLSALILMLLPFGMVAVMAAFNRPYLGELFGDPIGLVMTGIAAVLLVVGALWLRHIVRPVY